MLPIEPKDPGGAATAAEDAGEDIVARIRRRHQQMAAASTRLFDLPGYNGEVVARYKRLTYEQLRKVLFQTDADVVGKNAQFLIDACDEILFREDDGTLTPVVAGCKTTFEFNLESRHSFATVLGIEHIDTLHGQVVEAFAGNELALNDHAGQVHAWMVAANALDEETVAGEA